MVAMEAATNSSLTKVGSSASTQSMNALRCMVPSQHLRLGPALHRSPCHSLSHDLSHDLSRNLSHGQNHNRNQSQSHDQALLQEEEQYQHQVYCSR